MSPTDAGAGPRIRRPPEMYIGAAFLTVAALPLIVVGGALALRLGPLGANLRQRIADARTGHAVTGHDVDSVILLFRAGGGLLLVFGLLLAVLNGMVLRPRRWARTGAAVLAVLEIVLLVVGMAVTMVDPVSLGVVLLAAAGTVLLYLPRCEEFLLEGR